MNIIFTANKEELNDLKKYFEYQKKTGVSELTIIKELLSIGWTSNELESILPFQIKLYKKQVFKYKIYLLISIIFSFLFITLFEIFENFFNNLYGFLIISIFLMMLVSTVGFAVLVFGSTKETAVIDRRVHLFFNRFSQQFPINTVFDYKKYYQDIIFRNEHKIFLPIKEKSDFKLFTGYGQYKDKKFYLYVAKKFSHNTDSNNDIPVYYYYIFYEFCIRKVPFYYSLVTENNYEQQSKRIQIQNFKKGDFKDIDFAAREFNKKWKLRGSNKKLAYQIFGPHMMSLILKLDQKDLTGLEISDYSVMLSTKFSYESILRTPTDLNLVYEIAKQVERNYREINWD